MMSKQKPSKDVVDVKLGNNVIVDGLVVETMNLNIP